VVDEFFATCWVISNKGLSLNDSFNAQVMSARVERALFWDCISLKRQVCCSREMVDVMFI